jgi:DNA-binding NtrC family response regulator
VHIALPSLRERKEDIIPLAQLFLERFAEKYHRPLMGITPEAAEILESQNWNGNIRELQNVIERAVILSEAKNLSAKDLQIESSARSPRMTNEGISANGTLKAADESEEERLIHDAMERTGGNISAAAKILGVSRPTLYAKLKKYGL